MRRLLASVCLVAGFVLAAGPTQAGAAPADKGNCVSTRDNGGAAGARTSTAAGPGLGHWVAGAVGGGVIGDDARDPSCRPR
jgi:hypothetical protein